MERWESCQRRAAQGAGLPGSVPGAALFSRAFKEYAKTELPRRLRKVQLGSLLESHLTANVPRASTATLVRDMWKKGAQVAVGRRAKGPRRLSQQPNMTLPEIMDNLTKP